MKQVHSIEVGRPFTFKKKPYGVTVGSFFEIMNEDGQMMIVIYMDNIQKSEKKAIIKNKMKIKVIKEDDFMLLMIKFSDNLIFEFSFDPTLYLKNNMNVALSDIKKSNAISLFLVESTTNITKGIRYFTLPLSTFNVMMGAYENAFLNPDYSKDYNQWLNLLKMQTVASLWNKAQKI